MLDQIAELADDQPGFAQIAFLWGFSQIFEQSIGDGHLVFQQGGAQLFQSGNAKGDVQCGAACKVGPLV